ncbi:hypothetical protein [Nannocystis pusilla]|uniref:hypothetical protein n=1 Tax=Nannocystis pusilla TaxID=889268 RepID=UPI003B7814A1
MDELMDAVPARRAGRVVDLGAALALLGVVEAAAHRLRMIEQPGHLGPQGRQVDRHAAAAALAGAHAVSLARQAGAAVGVRLAALAPQCLSLET